MLSEYSFDDCKYVHLTSYVIEQITYKLVKYDKYK